MSKSRICDINARRKCQECGEYAEELEKEEFSMA